MKSKVLTFILSFSLLISIFPSHTVFAEEVMDFYFTEQELEDVPRSSGIESSLFYYQGQVARLVHEDSYFIQSLEDGERLEKLAFRQEDLFSGELMQTSAHFYYEQKHWFVFADPEKKEVSVRCANEKGELDDPIVLHDFAGQFSEFGITLRRAAADKNAIFLYAETDTQPSLFVYDWSGNLRATYASTNGFDIDGKGRFIYSQAPTEGEHYGLFCASSEDLKDLFQNKKLSHGAIPRYSFDQEKLYFLDSDRKLHTLSSETGKELGEPYAFNEDSNYLEELHLITDMLPAKDNTLYFNFLHINGENAEEYPGAIMNRLVAYERGEGAREEREVTLVLTAPYRTDFMMEAIQRYEKQYPEEHVLYDYAYNTQEQYLNHTEEYGEKLALSIIAGDIGDIVKTGGAHLAFRNLAVTDVFYPLGEWLKNNSHYDQLNPAVLQGLNIGGEIRGLPVFYMFNQYEWNEELAKQLGLEVDTEDLSWSEVLDLLPILEEKAPDHHLLSFETAGVSPWMSMGVDLLIVNMPDLIDFENQTFDLNQDWFKDLLKQFKKASFSDNLVAKNIEYDLQDRLQGALLRPWTSMDRILRDGQADFVSYNLEHASRMIPMIRGEQNPNRIAYSNYMYSVNARSERIDSALKFLDFLLNPEVQSLDLTTRTVPLNQDALRMMLDNAEQENTVASFHSENEELVSRKLREYREAFEKHASLVDYLYDLDYLKQDIMEPIERYMRNEIDLDEAIQIAEDNVTVRIFE